MPGSRQTPAGKSRIHSASMMAPCPGDTSRVLCQGRLIVWPRTTVQSRLCCPRPGGSARFCAQSQSRRDRLEKRHLSRISLAPWSGFPCPSCCPALQQLRGGRVGDSRCDLVGGQGLPDPPASRREAPSFRTSPAACTALTWAGSSRGSSGRWWVTAIVGLVQVGGRPERVATSIARTGRRTEQRHGSQAARSAASPIGSSRNTVRHQTPPPGSSTTCDDHLPRRANLYAQKPEIVERLKAVLEKYKADGRSTSGPAQPNTPPGLTRKTTSISGEK